MNSHHFTKYNKPEKYGVLLEVHPRDKARLEYFSKQETSLYNKLVEVFSSRVRSDPDSLLKLTEQEKKLYDKVAQVGIPITPLLYKTREDLPEEYKEFSDLLFGKESHPSKMSRSKSLVIDIASQPSNILPSVRKNMCDEFLSHYQDQARRFCQTSILVDQEYKEPIELLVEVSNSQKRHLQIPKKDMKIRWDEKEQASYIWTKYTVEEIKVPDLNLGKFNSWTTAIIHQDNVKKITMNTPWVIDFKKSRISYFIKLIDQMTKPRY